MAYAPGPEVADPIDDGGPEGGGGMLPLPPGHADPEHEREMDLRSSSGNEDDEGVDEPPPPPPPEPPRKSGFGIVGYDKVSKKSQVAECITCREFIHVGHFRWKCRLAKVCLFQICPCHSCLRRPAVGFIYWLLELRRQWSGRSRGRTPAGSASGCKAAVERVAHWQSWAILRQRKNIHHSSSVITTLNAFDLGSPAVLTQTQSIWRNPFYCSMTGIWFHCLAKPFQALGVLCDDAVRTTTLIGAGTIRVGVALV